MYLQATGVFTYSYATCNQIFLSKTDEQGNTREFTAIKAGDSLVLNQVESPNYGRYELISVDDAGDYVVLLVNNKDAQGTVIEGVKVAFQAFPASGGDSLWTDVDGKVTSTNNVNIKADLNVSGKTNTNNLFTNRLNLQQFYGDDSNYIQVTSDDVTTQMQFDCAFGGYKFITDNKHEAFTLSQTGEATFLRDITVNGNFNFKVADNATDFSTITTSAENGINFDVYGSTRMSVKSGGVSTTQDITVNGVTVGQGNGTGINNLSVGLESLGKNTEGTQNTSVGAYAMHENTSGNGNTVLGNSAFYRNTEGSDNTAIGNNALPFNTTGTLNTAVGANTLKANVSGGDNTALGNNALLVNEGSRNTALGYNALTNVTDANNSVAVGCSALSSFETGIDNIAIGQSSASTLTSGNNNIVIGTSAQPSSATVSNEVTIGNDDVTKTRLMGEIDVTTSGGSKVTLYDGAITTETTRSDLSVSHHIFKDENGQIGVIRSQDGNLYFDGLVTTFAQVEGLEAKLNAKDKLIEKLSARLDELRA